MEMIPHMIATHANNLTNGPPNTISPPRTTRPAPDIEDISFDLSFNQFILEPPFYILALTLRCLFQAINPPNLSDQYAR